MSTDLSITHPDIHAYLEKVRPASDPILREMEEYGEQHNFPYIGAQCGRILYALAVISGARRIFELGSGYGYSLYWMAKAMSAGGLVIGTENNPQNVARARAYFSRGGLTERADIRQGDALELFRREKGPFDLVMCDIGKEQYPAALALAKPRLRRGGILIADNILWSGKVADPAVHDPATEGIREFTRLIFADPDLFSTAIPIRDGLSISVKVRA